MSLLNCALSSNNSLVGKILEQGQRLRNSMVQTILKNDPFNQEILNSNSNRELKTLLRTETEKNNPSSLCRHHKCCEICNEYTNRLYEDDYVNLSECVLQTFDLTERPGKCSKLQLAKNAFRENQNLLRYVDSLRIFIYSLKLNAAGVRKVSKFDTINPNNTYCIEVSLPSALLKDKRQKTKAKVNSGLRPENKIRFLSKRQQRTDSSIYFKQKSIHEIVALNFNDCDLLDEKIEFVISYRAYRQRTPLLLIGKASLSLGALVANQFLTVEQELVILGENAPVALGHLKVTVQFGCEQLFFGKEFIDAISCKKENCNLSENDSIHKNSEFELDVNQTVDKKLTKAIPTTTTTTTPTTEAQLKSTDEKINNNSESNLLYAFIHISEVHISVGQPLNTYLICRGFAQEDTFISKIIYNDTRPNFNFSQLIPILLDEQLLERLRNNYIIVEVWSNKFDLDCLVGIVKLSLHQFYVAYKNPAIVQHLLKNQYPVLGVDWWEPITSPDKDCGQLRALIALGTQTQIDNFIAARNFKHFTISKENNETTSIRPCIKYNDIHQNKKIFNDNDSVLIEKNQNCIKNRECFKFDKSGDIEISIGIRQDRTNEQISGNKNVRFKSSDEYLNSKCIQTNIHENLNKQQSTESLIVDNKSNEHYCTCALKLKEFESSNALKESNNLIDDNQLTLSPGRNVEEPLCGSVNKVDASTQSDMDSKNDLFSKFLEQIVSTKKDDNSTNEALKQPQQHSHTGLVGNTSDLLETLNKALTNKPEEIAIESFRVHIAIERALHLPNRKRCKIKSKRQKQKIGNDEILPSAYVSFQAIDGLMVTSVVPKSCGPKWDFRCDVRLPSDLLLNNEKRLIFKVWRKSSGPSLEPNCQTDPILGFAALDLTVLISGLATIQGWFNIMDYSNKCNGQIKILVTPLENLSKFNAFKEKYHVQSLPKQTLLPTQTSLPESTTYSNTEDMLPSELLSRALKRKFTELDEITQRLRQRLSAVTNDDDDFDLSNDDEFVEEFERDLNTVSNEPLIETAILTETQEPLPPPLPTQPLEEYQTKKKLTQLDSHLNEGKLKIDSLLEKLTLLTSDNDRSFNGRHVSGCSVNRDPETIDPDLVFNPLLFQQMYTVSLDSTPRFDSLDSNSVQRTTLKNLISESSSSLQSEDISEEINVPRQAPEGDAGHI